MVKYSKYLLLIWVSMMSIELNAQFAQKSFDAIERDSEITRVTLENHLKTWSEKPLLNKIKSTASSYEKGEGLSVTIDAPNSRVFLENGVNWSLKEDQELLDTFYDEGMITLQQDRLIHCISKFLADFHTYLPQLPSNETYSFEVIVQDRNKENEAVKSTEKAALRKYKLTITIGANELQSLNNKNVKDLIKIEKEQL